MAAAQGADKVDVGKHEARQSTDKVDSGCGVLIGASPSSTVIVTVLTLSGVGAGACPQAVNVAKIIDPKLP